MATLTFIRSRVSNYHLALIALLSVAIIRPLIENLSYPLLPGWDTWNFLSLSTLVAKNGGWIPHWDTLQLQPDGRPFLYPPLIPITLANFSRLTGISLFWLIKTSTLVLYPALLGMTLAVARLFGDRRVVLLSAVFLLAINQVFINSLNSLSQITEIVLYLTVLLSLYHRRYIIAGICFGLTFWTHAFTPFFFGAGLLLYGILRPDERRSILAVTGIGVAIGSPWLIRMLFYSDWIGPNTQMNQHTNLWVWIWTIGAEGFPFFVMFGVLTLALLLDLPLARRLRKDRLTLLIACTTIGLAGVSYYPERSITYMAPGIAILLALVAFQTSAANLRRSLLFIFIAMGLVVLYTLPPINHFVPPPLVIYSVFLLIGLALIAILLARSNRNIVLAVLITVVFIEVNRYGEPLPLVSWAEPALMRPTNITTNAWEACQWLATKAPGTLISTSDSRSTNACNYLGLRTTTGAIPEFSQEGDVQNPEGAKYHIVTWLDWHKDREFKEGFIWQNENTAIYPSSSDKVVSYVRQFSLPPEVAFLTDLSVTIIAPERVTLGHNLIYKILVKNNGPDDGKAVIFTDELPVNAEFVSAFPRNCRRKGRTVTCRLGNLQENESSSITIEIKPTKGGAITNTAFAWAVYNDPEPANNTKSVTTKVQTPSDIKEISRGVAFDRTRGEFSYQVLDQDQEEIQQSGLIPLEIFSSRLKIFDLNTGSQLEPEIIFPEVSGKCCLPTNSDGHFTDTPIGLFPDVANNPLSLVQLRLKHGTDVRTEIRQLKVYQIEVGERVFLLGKFEQIICQTVFLVNHYIDVDNCGVDEIRID